MTLFGILVSILATLAITSGEDSINKSTDEKDCVQDVNCFLPDCFCATFSHPLGRDNIPQIVYFGFDDAVTPQVSVYFDELFTKHRKNPNGCPITMSLYVCHRYTEYDLVSNFFKESDEIAVHSVSHTFINTADKLRQEALAQRKNIVKNAEVPVGDIIGWRSPDLITAGDDQPRILKELHFTYDISLTYEMDDRMAFPFTLDFGYPYKCAIRPCPGKDSYHYGFWEVPINNLYDNATDTPCSYVDGCRPDGEEAAYRFLVYNFLRTYNGERAPFGLNMHAAWFYWPEYLRATHRFIDWLLNEHPDVYIISVEKMMAWMKNPLTIEASKTFQPWDCRGKETIPHKNQDTYHQQENKNQKNPTADDRFSLDPLRNWFMKFKNEKAQSKQTLDRKGRVQGSLSFRSFKHPG